VASRRNGGARKPQDTKVSIEAKLSSPYHVLHHFLHVTDKGSEHSPIYTTLSDLLASEAYAL
jgi:hypothetical protein